MKQQLAHQMINKWVTKLGKGFHPETRAEEYFDQNGKQSLTVEEQFLYEMDMELAFGYIGEEVFNVTLDCMKRLDR